MAGEFVIEHKSNYITVDVKEAGHEMEDWLLEHGGEETGIKEGVAIFMNLTLTLLYQKVYTTKLASCICFHLHPSTYNS